MEEIKPLELQELFNNAWNGVLVHGFSTERDGGGCLYTTVDGQRHCGIDWSIYPYITHNENSRTVDNLENPYVDQLFSGIDMGDLINLQSIHDNHAIHDGEDSVRYAYYIKQWAKAMVSCANEHDLVAPPLPDGSLIDDYMWPED